MPDLQWMAHHPQGEEPDLTPQDTLENARESAKRLMQIDDELAVLRSRIGGQGTGVSPRIDHSIILDVMRTVDECIVSEGDLPYEREMCAEYVDDGWVVVFGMDRLMREEGMDSNTRAAVIHALALRYLYAMPWDEISQCIKFDHMSTQKVCDAAIMWANSKGMARIKEAVSYVG